MKSWRAITRSTSLAIAFCTTLLVVPGAGAETDNAQSEKPIIGINMDVQSGNPDTYRMMPHYVDAITKSGGIPVMIPPMPESECAELVSRLDGVMMIGGNDYPPDLYKQEAHKTVVPMADARWKFDMMLVKEVLKSGKIPFLGICAGCQALNIGAGGSLVQDIPSHYTESKIMHSSAKGWQEGFNKHVVKAEDGTIISKFIGKDGLKVVTSHHQCVDKVGEGLRVAARTDDGVIESVEAKDKGFIVGVQWHPERDFESNQALFKEFIKQGQLRRAARKQERVTQGETYERALNSLVKTGANEDIYER
jgi:putative glutamine amidotransferase